MGLRQDVTAEAARAAHHALFTYLEEQIDAKPAHPGDDLLSAFAARHRQGELTRHEAASLGLPLLGAGHKTTADMIALGTLALLEHPEQLAVVRDTDDPQVLAGAVEELLRYLTIIHLGNRRAALERLARHLNRIPDSKTRRGPRRWSALWSSRPIVRV
ncbi:hypothetical protein [Streptomyces caelestis]|uniref:hypothetical protein n=1 Tax=Streptomyces caelestis TaxID=36816 RepID=UPI00364E5D24